MSGLAKREIPADPVLRAVLEYQNRAQQIVGRQRQIITCWNCQREHAEGSDEYNQVPGLLLAVCKNEEDCNDRADNAGLLPMLDGSGTDAS